MKKVIITCLVLLSVSAHSRTLYMDSKNSKNNELFIDALGLYRYKKAEDVYKKNCQDSSTEEIRKKCMMAEKAAWEKGKTPEEIKNQGTLYTGKIKVHLPNGKESYFYIEDGEKGDKIDLLLNRYYFEKGLLYDIKTERPVSTDIVIGGVEGLTENGTAPRFIAWQHYENGLPVGNPILIPVE